MRLNPVINIAGKHSISFKAMSDEQNTGFKNNSPQSDTFEKSVEFSSPNISDEVEMQTRKLIAGLIATNIHPDYQPDVIKRFAEPSIQIQRALTKTAAQTEKMEDTLTLLFEWSLAPENKAFKGDGIHNILGKIAILKGTKSENEEDESSFYQQSKQKLGEIVGKSGIDPDYFYFSLINFPEITRSMFNIIKTNLITRSIITDFMECSQKSGIPLPENIYASIYKAFKED